MHFPFFTAEVKCGSLGLAIADRQNLHSQTVAIRGLVTLFRDVGCEDLLHQQILGFSISYNDEDVRIYGHYPYISGEEVTYHRQTVQFITFDHFRRRPDHHWKAWSICRNIYDWGMKVHLPRIQEVIQMITHMRGQVERPLQPTESGLSQAMEETQIVDGGGTVVANEPPYPLSLPHRLPISSKSQSRGER
jgi:hypothetical protein